MTNTTKIQILRDALTDEHAWLEAQRKAISKGCGSSWDMGQCDERMSLIAAALRLTEGAQEAPGEDVDLPHLYRFDRINKGRVMAEGIGVHAVGMEEAERKAQAMVDLGDSLKFRSTAPCHPVRKCGICKAYESAPKAKSELESQPAPTPTAEVPAPKASTEPAPDCARSHPHEDMDAACEAKTVQARADFKRAVAGHAANPCTSNSLERQNPQNVDGKAKCADGERALFEATFDPFEFRRDYDKFGPSEAAFAVWQARGQQQAGVQDGWISVEDRLPEIGQQVIVFTPNRKFGDCILFDTWDEQHEDPIGMGGPTICTGVQWNDHEFEDISHWMPLPAAPAASEAAP